MQPCAVCGGVTINATGHCTSCGTFRGNPPQGQPPGYGGYQQPVSGPGYDRPMSGPGYGQPPVSGYPMSAPPGAQPASGGPAYGQPPISGGGYPATYPPPPGLANNGNKAKPFVVPLVALSATLVVLVVAIVVVVIVRSGGTDGPTTPVAGPSATAAPTDEANPDVDPCVVGRWEVTSHREDLAWEGVGEVEFTGGAGAIVELAPDGTGRTTYSGTTYEGTPGGDEVKLVFDGTIDFEFKARDSTISFSNMRASGTAKGFVDGREVTSVALEGGEDPANYTCSGGNMTQSTYNHETRLKKVG